MGFLHDLTHYPDYVVVFDRAGDGIGFLDLGNRLETFDKDAELLKQGYGISISRISPRECPEAMVPACRIYIEDAADILRKLIADGHSVLIARSTSQPVEQPTLQLTFLQEDV